MVQVSILELNGFSIRLVLEGVEYTPVEIRRSRFSDFRTVVGRIHVGVVENDF